jgi:hypothetical protein
MSSEREKEHITYRILSLLLRVILKNVREEKVMIEKSLLVIWDSASSTHFELVAFDINGPNERSTFFVNLNELVKYIKGEENKWIESCIELIITATNNKPELFRIRREGDLGLNTQICLMIASSAIFRRMIDSPRLIRDCHYKSKDHIRSESYKYLLTFLILESHVLPSIAINSQFLELISI